MGAICIVALISYSIDEPDLELTTLFPRLYPFLGTMFALYLILFIAFLTIVIFVYSTNKENEQKKKKVVEVTSPLLGAAKQHQQPIVEMLKSVAMPAPNKQTINHAKTAKFIHALTALELIDCNRDSKHLMAWIEQATNYPAGQTRVFNQALKAVKVNDPDVLKYQEQIAQIIAQ